MTTPDREDPFQVITDYQAWADAIREERLARIARERHEILTPDKAPTLSREPVTDDSGLDARLRADFGGTSVVVHRSGIGYLTTYTFTAVDEDGHAHTLDTRALGIAAAGDDMRSPQPEREEQYRAIGSRVRAHLVGLVDAVAGHRINAVRLAHLRELAPASRPTTVREL